MAAASGGRKVGDHPLTLWLVSAVVIVFLYLRRSNVGIDTHPAEGATTRPSILRPSVALPPVLPSARPLTNGWGGG